MQTQAYFENIQSHIIQTLEEAEQSIHIAIAWFTDREIFNTLLQKAKENTKVEIILINDHINRGDFALDFSLLEQAGGEILWIGEGGENEDLMHNKFTIIDKSTVITGSYNWSKKAQRNYENITVIKENEELANQFLKEFFSIQKKFGKKTTQEEESLDFAKILKRMEILKNTIALEDEDDIEYQALKIKKLLPKNLDNFQNLQDISQILALLKKEKFSEAMPLIINFIQNFNRIAIFEDPELNALKLEIRMLEIRLTSLQDEKTDIEKIIREFQLKYDRELGELILKVLKFRKSKAEKEAQENPQDEAKQKEKEASEKDYQNYQKGFEESKKQKIYHLEENDKKELKKLYRKSSKICHPDTVAADLKEKATAIFIELDKAYKEQNLEKVREIYENLKKGFFSTQSQSINEVQKLKSSLKQMKEKIEEILQNIQNLKTSDIFQKIQGIEDWNAYFCEMKEALKEELNYFEENL